MESFKLLLARCSQQFQSVQPVDATEIEVWEQATGYRLPEDFRQFLLQFGACQLGQNAGAKAEVFAPDAWAEIWAETCPYPEERAAAPAFQIVAYDIYQGWWLGFDASRGEAAFQTFTVDTYVEEWSQQEQGWMSFAVWLEHLLTQGQPPF